jgi:hypothetical protein
MKKTDISVEALGAIRVYNKKDEAVRLSDLWNKKKAVLVFVRHFG